MNTPHILVLTVPGDRHAHNVSHLLRERGALVTEVDPAIIPTRSRLTTSITSNGGVTRTLIGASGRVDLEAVDSVWFRRPGAPKADPAITDPEIRTYIEEECEAHVSTTWDDLNVLAVPGSRADIRDASRKTTQLARAHSIGFVLPETLITTDSEEFLDFWYRHRGQVITKPLHMPGILHKGRSLVRMAEIASTADVAETSSLRLCPLIIQEYAAKRSEIRVTVVGEDVFAAEIHSQQSNHTKIDWRSYDSSTTRYTTHELPARTAQFCRELVHGFGLCYGAIDLVLTPDDRYVFLEVNPSGQWLWIEDATGLPITRAIADLLIGSKAAQTSTEKKRILT